MAAVRATRSALPVMLAAGRGAVVNVSSVNAFLPDLAVIDYCAAKAALANFSKALSKKVGPRGCESIPSAPVPSRQISGWGRKGWRPRWAAPLASSRQMSRPAPLASRSPAGSRSGRGGRPRGPACQRPSRERPGREHHHRRRPDNDAVGARIRSRPGSLPLEPSKGCRTTASGRRPRVALLRRQLARSRQCFLSGGVSWTLPGSLKNLRLGRQRAYARICGRVHECRDV